MNVIDNTGSTPLIAAPISYQCLRLLLLAGANINGNSSTKENALTCHMVRHRPPLKTCIMLLHAAGETVVSTVDVPVPEFLQSKDVNMQLKHIERSN